MSASATFALLLATAVACGGPDPDQLALQAASPDAVAAASARAQLREMGPAGLDVLLEAYPPAERGRPEVAAALDAVGGQRDNAAARLYWYTDLERAKAASRSTGMPILSLRLLGRLDSDLSCATSRYFRTVLYANETVSGALRERFILHWASVRDVPLITIDFGDGRRIERTITGNSLHYVLGSEGRPLDALPGLYGPRPFLAWLDEMEALNRTGASLEAYHAAKLESVARSWARDLAAARRAPAVQRGRWPEALEAVPVAMTKSAIERPVLEAIAPRTLTDAQWGDIGLLHLDEARLDRGSLALMAAKTPDASAGALAALIERFERTIALDIARNEYLFHGPIHEWYVTGRAGDDLEVLNDRIYAELFLTPREDPWLGLLPAAYAALDHGGVVAPPP